MKYNFKRSERLKSKKIISNIFSNGKVIGAFPIKLFYIETELNSDFPIQFAFSVSKKKFKRAVDRNRIKRLMREVVRLKKHELLNASEIKNRQFALLFLYVGNELPDYKIIDNKVAKSMKRFKDNI